MTFITQDRSCCRDQTAAAAEPRARDSKGSMAGIKGNPAAEPNESSYMLRGERQLHRRYRITVADGEWGWYVVSGSAFANFLLPGMLRSFMPDVLDGFVGIQELMQSEIRFDSCWIPAAFNLTFYIAGSLSCLLCGLASHRTVTFWGGLLAFTGMVSTSFANSVPYLYISYGLLVAFGAGLCCPAGLLIVNEYFDRRRGLANGLSQVGTTIGSLALPPYQKFLTSSYGYRGGILIISGMILNVLASALIYKPACKHVRVVSTVSSSSSSSSINALQDESTRAINSGAHHEHYATVAQTPAAGGASSIRFRMRRLIGGKRKSVTDFLAVSAVNAVGHLACAVLLAAAATRPYGTDETALQLAAAEAAGRALVPTISDLLSSGGSASVYLYAVVTASTGAVLLAATPSLHLGTPVQPFAVGGLLVAFGLATSGAAVGLEPLVAVRVLGRGSLSASSAITLLGKGVAQLAVDLLLPRGRPHPLQAATNATLLYALGTCLMAAAGVWTAVFLFRRLRTAAKNGRGRYSKTA